jgi:succinoglycan biosynthesis protein ExoM
MTDASILIPTFRRPALLTAAIRSALAQQGLPSDRYEVVVVDNCPDHSARGTVAPFLCAAGSRLRLVHEPRPGISHARNSAVRASRGRLVAFLDDDEVATPDWLAAIIATQGATGADAIFGPIQAVLPRNLPDRAFFQSFFSRDWRLDDRADVTGRAAHLGTNNSAFVRATCFATDEAFAPDLGTIGGEDSLLLRALVRAGRRFAWSADALVAEVVPDERANYAYVRRRRFRSGQIRTLVSRRAGSPFEVAAWMGVGLAQAAVWGATAAILAPVRRAGSAQAATRAAGGLGKLFWTRSFRFAMYGADVVHTA